MLSRRPPHNRRRHAPSRRENALIFYGQHAVAAALRNPERQILALYHCRTPEADLIKHAQARSLPIQTITQDALKAMLPEGSVHQGVAAQVAPLPRLSLTDLLSRWQAAERTTLVVLDQIFDPRNLGTVLRSAYCLGATAVLCPERHSASESGTVAKAASGALEAVPLLRLGNLARGLAQLKEAGFWCYGFSSSADILLSDVDWPSHSALVFGAEAQGLRRLSAELCDQQIAIPQNPDTEQFGIDSLNLAQSVSIALYARSVG